VQAGWERALTETEMELKHARAEVQRLLVAGEKREVALGMNPIRTIGTKYDRKPGIKWLSCTAK
jgi:hypothetical protein